MNLRKKFFSFLIITATIFMQLDLNTNASNVESFTYETADDGLIITGYTGSTSGTITIPAEINGMKVAEVGEKAFFTTLGTDSTVIVSEGIKRIGDYAFTGFIGNGINSIYLPKTIESIGKYSIGYTYFPPEVCKNYYDENYRYHSIMIYGYPGTIAEKYAKDTHHKFIPVYEEIPTEETTSSDISEPTLPTEESLPTITSTSETTDSTTEVTSTTISEPTTLDEPTEPTLIGDTDVNGVVELADLTLLSKHLLSETAFPLPNATARANADMNGDGLINIVDLSELINNQLGRQPT